MKQKTTTTTNNNNHETSIASNWQVREVNETLSGVTQLKIGDICLFMCGLTLCHFVL